MNSFTSDCRDRHLRCPLSKIIYSIQLAVVRSRLRTPSPPSHEASVAPSSFESEHVTPASPQPVPITPAPTVEALTPIAVQETRAVYGVGPIKQDPCGGNTTSAAIDVPAPDASEDQVSPSSM